MNARLFLAKSRGQSIPIIALILVVLFAMVGLSVDVGNTYAQNRSAVRATNAAALAGMDRLITSGDTSGSAATDVSIGDAIKASFKSNGITAQIDPTAAVNSSQRRILAYYLDSYGNPLGDACTVGKCGGVPANVAYIQINTAGTVDTYFARVVGQTTLPVKAQSFAGQCTPVKGVYPIAVNAASIDFKKGGFVPPSGVGNTDGQYYGTYYDEIYNDGTATQRRIYRDSDFSHDGNFDFMQWPTSGGSLATMMASDGNLDLGFDEVVLSPPIKSTTGTQYTTGWPDPSQAEVANYPLLPHQLSEGDWLYGVNYVAPSGATTALKAALDYHITNRTKLNLPIVDRILNPGTAKSYYEFQKMGAFLLRKYDLSGTKDYFDLVYLGESSKTACLSQNVSQGAKGLGLSGQVYVNPRWQQPLQPHQPIAYNIVLDLSGSMSWDFNGYGTMSGRDYQCESPNNPNPSSLSYTDQCDGGPHSSWKNQSERRVYVAKNAIFKFINSMGQYDMMRVVGFSSDMTGNAAPSAKWVVTSDQAAKDALITTVKNMGMYNSDPYKTSGGTPGPDALATAATMFQSAAGYTPTAGNGKTFRPVVIYFTDGVANVFQSSAVGRDDGATNDARDVCPTITAAQARNTADPCQLGTTSSGKARPITAMVNIANSMKSNNTELAIYAVGLAQVPSTGLPRVANSPDMFFAANKGDAVQSILDIIQAQVTGATCAPTGGYSWLNTIDSTHAPTGTPFSTLGSGVFGQVFIYEQGAGTAKYVLPITLDQSVNIDGRLGYSIASGVTPGIYEMEAFVGYRGEDGVTRSYDYFIDPSALSESHRISVQVTSASTLGGSVPLQPIFMDLKSTVQVCPAGP